MVCHCPLQNVNDLTFDFATRTKQKRKNHSNIQKVQSHANCTVVLISSFFVVVLHFKVYE